MEELIDAYLVKYCSNGIIDIVKILKPKEDQPFARIAPGQGFVTFSTFVIGRDIFLDKGEALAAAEKIVEKKMESAERQLRRLENLELKFKRKEMK